MLLDVKAIRDTLKDVQRNKSTLMIGTNRRIDPNFAELERHIRVGAVGDIELVTVISRDPSPPPGSICSPIWRHFRDMTIHDFDLTFFMKLRRSEAVAAKLTPPTVSIRRPWLHTRCQDTLFSASPLTTRFCFKRPSKQSRIFCAAASAMRIAHSSVSPAL